MKKIKIKILSSLLILYLMNSVFSTLLFDSFYTKKLFAQVEEKNELHLDNDSHLQILKKNSNDTDLDLEDLISEALENNPNILAAQKRWVAAKNRVKSVKSLDEPSLKVGLVNSPDHPFNLGKDPVKTAPIMSPQTISITQKIPFPGKLRLRGKAAEERAAMGNSTTESIIQDVIAQVKHTYYELYFIDKSIDINHENKELLYQFTKIAEAMYAVGKSSQRDVLAAMVELSKMENNIIILKQNKKSMQARLNNLLYRDPDASLGRPKEFKKHKLRLNLEELEEMALNSRPLLQRTNHEVKKNQFNLQLAKKEYFSDFTAMIEYRHIGEFPSDTWSSALSINIPWLWSKQRYKVKEAKEELKASLAEREAINSLTQFELRDLISKVVSTENTVELFKINIIPKAKQSLEAARIGYETGNVDFLALIDSQRTLLDSKLQYYKSLVEYQQNFALLENTVGRKLAYVSD